MTTIKQFKQWLNRFSDDTEIQQEAPEDIKFLPDTELGDGWEYKQILD